MTAFLAAVVFTLGLLSGTAQAATATASSSGWVSHGTDGFNFRSTNGTAAAVGTVRWFHGKFPKGYLHRGNYTGSPIVVAMRPTGCIWATTAWGYPLGSVSIPPGFSVSGAETRGKWLVSCRRSGSRYPGVINLNGLGYAKALLNSTTLTICTSARRADGPRFCANHKMTY